MPAGVGWSQYLRFSAAAFAAMMAGSQTVHYYYRPLEDLNKYIDREFSLQQEISQRRDTTIILLNDTKTEMNENK